MAERKGTAPADLMPVAEIAEEFGLAESTVWLHLRRYALPRYRMPLYGKKTLVSRADFERAMKTATPVETGKAAVLAA